METGIWFLASLFSTANAFILGSQVCYGDLGCFDNTGPFESIERPVNVLPQSPQHIATGFLLYTRANPTYDVAVNVPTFATDVLRKSPFDVAKPTKFVIHGYTSSGNETWVHTMVAELLKHDEMNVFVVDWENGAKIPYMQSVANARLVGAQLAQFISFLNKTGAPPPTMHLIGHSLGAHVAGYGGERLTNLHRITGLDPASPYFEHTDRVVRLDPTDAHFVDVIHTDTGDIIDIGMGMRMPTGHVDFYPNGGRFQAGCPPSKISGAILAFLNKRKEGARSAFMCSHRRAYHLFTESINSKCPFVTFPCHNESELHSGKCIHFSKNLSRMGYLADKSPGRGVQYLETMDHPSYCCYHYQVSITAKSTVDGKILFTLRGTNGTSSVESLMTKDEIVHGNQLFQRVLKMRTDIGELQSITIEFDETENKLIGWIFTDDWKLDSVSLYSGEHHRLSKFCVHGTTITSKMSKTFYVHNSCP